MNARLRGHCGGIGAGAFLALLLVGAAMVPARAEMVDRIIAVVGDQIILQSEVEEELYLAGLRGGVDSADPEAVEKYRREIVDSKIEEKILVAKARAEGVRITRDEVESAVDRMVEDIRSRFPDEGAFVAQLEREGMSLDDLRDSYEDRVEEQLMVRQVMDRLVRSRVSVDDHEVRRYWEENREQIPAIPAALELRRILVSLKSEAGIDSASVERAGIVLRRLLAGEDFATLASVFSEGPAAPRGGELGWFAPGDLEPRLAAAVKNLSAGEISDVVITGRGAHILKVTDERDDGQVHLRQIVFLRDEEAARAAARARAESILRRVRSGESFAAVAQAESDDAATRENGGELGRVPIEALNATFREGLESLAPGEASDILEDDAGLSIFLVEGKEGERPATFEDVHDRIAALLEQQQAQEIYQEIIDEAREATYVENRLTSAGG